MNNASEQPLAIDASTEEVQRVPAHTKPHYWIAVRGADVWNRWAREGLPDEWFAVQRKRILDLQGLEDSRKQELLQRIDDFDKLKSEPLTKGEKDEILADIQQYADSNATALPNNQDEIDFSNTVWGKEYSNIFNNPPVYREVFDFSAIDKILDDNICTISDTFFENIIITQYLTFLNSKFIEKIRFNNTLFLNYVDFRCCTFNQTITNFENSIFFEETELQGSEFKTLVFLYNSIFISVPYFQNAIFKNIVLFDKAIFYETTNFCNTEFQNTAVFQYVKFHKDADFEKANFYRVPSFTGASCEGVWYFTKDDAHWPQFKKTDDEKWENIATDYAQLRKRMEELKLHDDELFFHGKELQARSYDCLSYKDKDKRKYWLGRLYQLYGDSCNYGQSVLKPSLLILTTIAIFFCLYWAFIIGYSDFPATSLPPFTYAGYLAWHNAFSFLPTDTATHAQLFNLKAICDGAEAVNEVKIPLRNHACGTWFAALSGIQKLFSVLCWFLVALGLRNRLRMR